MVKVRKARKMRTESEWREIITYAAVHGVAKAAEYFKVNPSMIHKHRGIIPQDNSAKSNGATKAGRLTDIITYANKALECVASRDTEGVSLYLTHIRRAAQGKE